MSCEVVTTRGGARAILDHATGEVMHPIVGPLVEPKRIYIEPSRLAERLEGAGDPLVLLDVGLGAAGVAIAAWHVSEARSAGRKLEIVSFDHGRTALEVALTCPTDFALEDLAGEAARSILDRGVHETERTRWRFVEGELPEAFAAEPAGRAEIVYWDAFSPKRNPKLWTLAAFVALRRLCSDTCTVHTFSGATATRSTLMLAGFAVGVGEPIGSPELRKHSTCAAVRLSDVERPLDRRWLERLGRSSAPFSTDAPPDAMEIIARSPQLG